MNNLDKPDFKIYSFQEALELFTFEDNVSEELDIDTDFDNDYN